MELALFDFDETISTKDSFADFIEFACDRNRVIRGYLLLLPAYILYKAAVTPPTFTKELYLAHFFKGMDEAEFRKKAGDYAAGRIRRIVKESALDRIRWHHGRGHRVAVASGAFDILLEDFCRGLGLDLIAAGVEFRDGKVTGRLSGRHCVGKNKAVMVKEKYDLESFDRIYAYGNSREDRALLELADEKYYRSFS